MSKPENRDVPVDHWRAQGGWKLGHVANDAYALLTVEQRIHDFDNVYDMRVVDDFYARLVAEHGGKVRHVNLPIVEKRYCELPGCHKPIETGARVDRRYCSDAHRKADSRRVRESPDKKGKR